MSKRNPVEVWQKVVDRRRLMWEGLNGDKPVDTCGHPLGVLAYAYQPWWHAPMYVFCVDCVSAEDGEGFPPFYPEACEACGNKPPGEFAVAETFVIPKPVPALPKFEGEITAPVAVVCDDCAPAIREWAGGQWRLEELDRLMAFLRWAGPHFAAKDLAAGEIGVLCNLHRLGIERKLTSTLCFEEHKAHPVQSCSVCGDHGVMRPVAEALEIPERSPLQVVDEFGGEPRDWWGRILVEPFAYVCEAHWPLWRRLNEEQPLGDDAA